MDELTFLVELDVDGGFVAPAVGHSIVTQADTEDELRKMVPVSIRCRFDETDRSKQSAFISFATM